MATGLGIAARCWPLNRYDRRRTTELRAQGFSARIRRGDNIDVECAAGKQTRQSALLSGGYTAGGELGAFLLALFPARSYNFYTDGPGMHNQFVGHSRIPKLRGFPLIFLDVVLLMGRQI